MTFVMVLSDACDDVSYRMVDHATYVNILVIYIRRTFFTLERCCACEGGTSSYFDVHAYSYFLHYMKFLRFQPCPHLARLALSHVQHSE